MAVKGAVLEEEDNKGREGGERSSSLSILLEFLDQLCKFMH